MKILTKKRTPLSTDRQINIYKSLDFIPVYNYYKTVETNDLRYLLKLNDYEALPEIDMSKYRDVWDKIVDDVQQVAIDNDKGSKIIFEKRRDLLALQIDYALTQQLISILSFIKDDDCIKMLAEHGFRINKNKDYYKELKRVKKQSQILKTKIEIKEEDLRNATKGGSSDAWKEIEAICNYNKQDIDIHRMPMRRYLTKKYMVLKDTAKKKI